MMAVVQFRKKKCNSGFPKTNRLIQLWLTAVSERTCSIFHLQRVFLRPTLRPTTKFLEETKDSPPAVLQRISRAKVAVKGNIV